MRRISRSKARLLLVSAAFAVAIGAIGCCECENNVEVNPVPDVGDSGAVDHIYAISNECGEECTASARIVDQDGTFEVARGDVVLFVNFTNDVVEVLLNYSGAASEKFTMPMNSTRRVTIKQDVAEPGPPIHVSFQVVDGDTPHGGPGMRVKP